MASLEPISIGQARQWLAEKNVENEFSYLWNGLEESVELPFWVGALDLQNLNDLTLDDEILLRSFWSDVLGVGGLVLGLGVTVLGVVAAPITGGASLSLVPLGVGLFGAGLNHFVPLQEDIAELFSSPLKTAKCTNYADFTIAECGGFKTSSLLQETGCLRGIEACGEGWSCAEGTACAFGCCELLAGSVSQSDSLIRYAISLPIPKNVAVDKIGIWGAEYVRVNDRARVVDQRNAGAPVAQVGSAGLVRIGVDAKVGDVYALGQSVEIANRAQVGALLSSVSPHVGDGAIVNQHGVDSHLEGEMMFWSVDYPLGASRQVMLEPGERISLPHGKYQRITVKPRSTLFLSSGVYFIDHLYVEPESRIVTDGHVVVAVKNSAVIRGGISGEEAENTIFYYLGVSDMAIGTGFLGTVIAPYARVNCDIGASSIRGAIWARAVEVHQGASLIVQDVSPWNILAALR